MWPKIPEIFELKPEFGERGETWRNISNMPIPLALKLSVVIVKAYSFRPHHCTWLGFLHYTNFVFENPRDKLGFSGGTEVKNSPANASRDGSFNTWVGKTFEEEIAIHSSVLVGKP